MIVAAIDPGLTGAIAMFDLDRDECTVSIHKMPTYTVSISNIDTKMARCLNIIDVNRLKMIIQLADRIIIEKIVPYSKDSKVSCFSFGGAFHSMLTAFNSLHTVYEVDPKSWKKTFNLMSTDKDCVIERAVEISKSLPHFKLSMLPSLKHTRIAFCDAYLIGIHYLKSIGFLTLEETIKRTLIV